MPNMIRMGVHAVTVLAVAACGGDKDPVTVDAAVADGVAVDADASTAAVTVTRAELPEAGVTVVFQDAAGAVLGTAMTGADGVARGHVVAGGQVTAALGAAGERHLVTVVGVQPGDALQIVDPSSRLVAVTTPSGNPGSAVSVIVGNFGCSTNTTGGTSQISLTEACITGTTFPVLATTTSGLTRYFAFKKGTTPAATGTTAVTGLSAWTAGTAFTLSVDGLPPTGPATAYLGQIANGQPAALAPDMSSSSSGQLSATFTVATGYPEALQPEVQIRTTNGPGQSQIQSYSKRVAAATSTVSLAISGQLLPTLLTATMTTTDPARAAVAWTAEASLGATDGGVARMAWTTGAETGDWTFIVPPTATSVTAPALPAALAAFAPTSTSTFAGPAVMFAETDLVASYDALRAQLVELGLGRIPLGDFSNLQVPALPADGTLRLTSIAP